MSLFTCELCGQDGLTEVEMRTHRLIAHIDSEVSCMFCDLRGVTVDEMNYHINTAHSDQQSNNSVRRSSTERVHASNERDRHSDSEISSECETSEDVKNIVQHPCSRVLLYSRVGGSKDKTRADDSLEQEGNNSKRYKMEEDVVDHCNEEVFPSAYWFCPLCDYIADDDALLQVHITVDHNDMQNNEPSNEAEASPCTLLCPVCSTEFVDELHLQFHVDEHFPTEQQVVDECHEQRSLSKQHVQERSFSHHLSVGNAVLRDQTAQLKERQAREAARLSQERLRESTLLPPTSAHQNVKKSGNCHSQQRNQQVASQDCENHQGCTSGIIERLSRDNEGMGAAKARFLCSATDHFKSYGWDCGYRNLQILMSSLVRCPVYLQSLFNGTPVIPSVLKLQKLLEAAWSKGFDRTGCAQLNGNVVGTRKWIGATEIAALLSSLHIKCEIYDFHRSTGVRNTHPLLFDFVRDHFKTSSGTFVPPLYFQRHGHSITIVGVEETPGGAIDLLVFDPGCHKMAQLLTAKRNEMNGAMTLMRRTLSMITSKQYQILKVVGTLSEAELE